MAGLLLWILLFAVLGSIASLVGGIFLLWKEHIAKKISLGLVSFASGVLLSAAFLGLLPESIELINVDIAVVYVLIGISTFYIIEKLFIWHHCHDGECKVHLPSYMILFGDSVHNFIDGIIIAASFIVSIPLGIVTSLGVIAHEIPQEIGDFGVMLHGGWEKKKIIIYNLLSASTTIIGAVVAYFALPYMQGIEGYLLAFAAGTFIYISTTDLIPEVHRDRTPSKTAINTFLFFLGIGILWFTIKIIGHH